MTRDRQLIGVYVVGGSLIAIFQRFLTFSLDSFTINAGRFVAGSATLLLLALIFRRAELRALLRRPDQMRNIAILAVLGFIPQILYVEGLARTSAVVSSFIGLLGLPLSIALAVAIFPDERQAVRGPGFALGALLAVGATVGLALGQGDLTLEYSTGVLFTFAGTVIGVAMGLLIKRLVITSDPLCVSGMVTTFSAVLFVAATLVWGDSGSILSAPPLTILVLFGSGAYGLLIGGAVYTLIIKRSGLVIARFADLAMPVFTGLFGLVLFDERLTPLQVIFGAVLLVGCSLVLTRRGSAAISLDA